MGDFLFYNKHVISYLDIFCLVFRWESDPLAPVIALVFHLQTLVALDHIGTHSDVFFSTLGSY